MLKLVVFDFDGVLFNSAKYFLKTRSIFFKKYNIKFTKQENKDNLATTTKDFLKYVNKKYNLKISYSFYKKEKKKIFYSFIDSIKINPGVLKLLKDLKKNKVKIAISSSNEKENIYYFLEKYDLKKYFDLILTSEDIKKHKPLSEPFLKPTKILKINPRESIGIEDSLQGIISIKKAKLKSIALLSEFTNKSDFKKLNTDLIVKSINDLNYKKLSTLFREDYK